MTDITVEIGSEFQDPVGRLFVWSGADWAPQADYAAMPPGSLIDRSGYVHLWDGRVEHISTFALMPGGPPTSVASSDVAPARELPRNFDARPPRDYAERLLGMME